jgi:hypothetical protein
MSTSVKLTKAKIEPPREGKNLDDRYRLLVTKPSPCSVTTLVASCAAWAGHETENTGQGILITHLRDLVPVFSRPSAPLSSPLTPLLRLNSRSIAVLGLREAQLGVVAVSCLCGYHERLPECCGMASVIERTLRCEHPETERH